MISDTEIYQLESIRDEFTELIDEAKAIVASTDGQYIADEAEKWIKIIKKNIYNKTNTNVSTMSTTIDELWNDWYDHYYAGEDNE